MPVDERRRLQLANAAKRILGDDEGITLMELLPPVGWGDVATKQDLVLLRRDLEVLESRLESRLVARFEKGFRQIIVTMASLMVGGFFATVLAALLR